MAISKTNDPNLKLDRIRVKNFRSIKELDITIPKDKRIICLVGENGSGKSSLISWMISSLCSLTNEIAPDLVKTESDRSINSGNWVRWISSNEVGPESNYYGVRFDWSYFNKTNFYDIYVNWNHKENSSNDDMSSVFDGNIPSLNGFSYQSWKVRTPDPISKSVFLVRPTDRFETPWYSLPKNLKLQPELAQQWSGHRLLPISPRSSALFAESFIIDILTDSVIGNKLSLFLLDRFKYAFEEVTKQKFIGKLHPWPFRHWGLRDLEQLSLLSAGELDVIGTVALILAQQGYIVSKYPNEFSNEKGEILIPGGYVFIDEIDSHLHPQWQQNVLPALSKTFPNLNFIITTHSPFILRSLKKENSIIIRLPDGAVFDEEFSSWSIEEILETIFSVPPQWNDEITQNLKNLEKHCRANKIKNAIELYKKLMVLDNSRLHAVCRKLIGLYGSQRLIKTISRL